MSDKVVVFGGSGQLGKVLLKQLSQKTNIKVVAISRNPENLPKLNNVRWVKGDPFDYGTYVNQMEGASAVFGVLGSDTLRNPTIFSKAYPQIIKGMQKQKVTRFIFVSSCYNHQQAPCFFTYFIKPLFLSKIYADMAQFDKYLQVYKGPVAYTNLRPFEFYQGKRKQYKAVLSGSQESRGWNFKTNLEDLAQTIIKVYSNKEFLNQSIDVGEYQ